MPSASSHSVRLILNTALSLTGLGLLFYLKKVRLKGTLTLMAGAVIVVILAAMAT